MSSKGLFAFNIKAFKWCANVHFFEKMGFFATAFVRFSLLLAFLHNFSLVLDLFLFAMGDFQRFCEDVPMAMAFTMVFYEFHNTVTRRKTIEGLLRDVESTTIHYPSYGAEWYRKTSMGKLVDVLDRLGFYNISIGVVCVALWVLRPIVSNTKIFPFGNSWVPFYTEDFYYGIVVWQTFVATCGAINSINIHIFYGKIIAVISQQFDVLAHSFRNIDEDLLTLGSAANEQEIFYRVKELIRYHQKLLRCCAQLQECMSGILACQFCFGISLGFAALASFSIVAVNAAFINLVNHIMLEISELFLYCWFVDQLTTYGLKVRDGVFYSRWYLRPDKTKQLLRFVIMRSTKPVVIRAGGVLPVSIASFLWILQQSYSCFMVLRQMRVKAED